MAKFFGRKPTKEIETTDGAKTAEELNLEPQQPIGRKEVNKAIETLNKYKIAKSNLEERIVQDELWYQLRHWEIIRNKRSSKMPERKDQDKLVLEPTPEPSSAWLFNSIVSKHADAMDNYPEPVVLPRERDDVESARMLSEVLPVVLEYNDFQTVYDENWWEKLKHGTAPYGVFWDNMKDNGLGDIAIRKIDLLNIFFEPGITDIQQSRNLFITELVDDDILLEQYPQLEGKLTSKTIDIKEYIYDDDVDTSEKSVVVDWYYKVRTDGGRTILHYVKFVGETVLYASENDPDRREVGFYDHGKYPVVFDTLYPEKGTPVGFGYIAITKSPQMYIDKMDANIMEAAVHGTKKRYFVSNSANVNVQEFMDWSHPIVHVEGELSDARIQEINTSGIDASFIGVRAAKIEEMKDTSANRDVNNGGTGSGVTAASAIAALQEAGNKVSRDMIQHSYQAYNEIVELCVELMRQFYDSARSFRIVGQTAGEYEFIDLSNAQIKEQKTGYDEEGNELYRKPTFDLKIKAQKRNPFSRMEENERAKELYSMGFFDPARAQEALGALKMMDFEGKDELEEYISQGQTMKNLVEQYSELCNALAAQLGMQGQNVIPDEGGAPAGNAPAKSSGLTGEIMQAHTPMTDYGQALAKRSVPSVEG